MRPILLTLLLASSIGCATGRFTVEVMPWYGPAGLTYDGYEPPKAGARCEP